MNARETWKLLSYVVTVIGLPLAIVVFVYEQRKERQNDEEEIFQRLSDEYREFLKLVLDNADLHLLRREGTRQEFTEEQKERRLAIFGILISLFERAYLLVYEDNANIPGASPEAFDQTQANRDFALVRGAHPSRVLASASRRRLRSPRRDAEGRLRDAGAPRTSIRSANQAGASCFGVSDPKRMNKQARRLWQS